MTNASTLASDRAFLAVATLLFGGSVAMTIVWCVSMSAMSGMPMPGGWTMTMMWMRMPGQTWLEGAASFVGMWTVMMMAMMLPSLVVALLRLRGAVRRSGHARPGVLTVFAGTGYFFVWGIAGALIYPAGVALAALAMRQPELSRAAPFAIGAVVAFGLAVQFSPWKGRQLACWRALDRLCVAPPTAARAWRTGLQLGWDCIRCGGNLMVILLVLGVMDLGVMAAITVVMTFERVLPAA